MASGRFIIPATQVNAGIVKARDAAGFTDVIVAESIGAPLASYRAIERGEGGVSIGMLYSLADALNIKPDQFFGGSGT